jgi:hypothetical protein
MTPPLRYQAKTVTGWFQAQPDLAESRPPWFVGPDGDDFSDLAQAVVDRAVTV